MLHFNPSQPQMHDDEFGVDEFKLRMPISHTDNGPFAYIDFCWPSTIEECEISEATMNRIYCHWALEHLSDISIHDIVEVITEIARVDKYITMPSLQLCTELQSSNSGVKATLGDTYLRPVFPMNDGE